MGGLVVLAISHKNPLSTYREIFNGSGINWFGSFCSSSGTAHANACTAAGNLQQTLIQSPSSMLTRARRRLCVPLRDVQHRRAGPVHRRDGRGRLARHVDGRAAGGAPRADRDRRARRVAGAIWGGIAGFLKATDRRPRGDLDDHAQLDRDLGRRATSSASAARCRTRAAELRRSRDRSTPRAVTDELGRRSAAIHLPQGLHMGLFIALGALVVYWIVLNRTTLGLRGQSRGIQRRGRPVRRDQRLQELLHGDGDLRGVRRPRRRDGHPRLAVPARPDSRPDVSQIAFIGIAVALLGRNTMGGIFLAALLFGAH